MYEPKVETSFGDEGILRVEVILEGNPTRQVWKAWAEPWHLQGWWAPQAEVETRPGGRIRLFWPKQEYELRGRVIESIPEEKLSFTWQWTHGEENYPLLTRILLEPRDRGLSTRMVIEQERFDPAKDQGVVESLKQGWEHFLPKMAKYVGNMTLV